MTFASAPDLVGQLAKNDVVSDCLSRNWFRFAVGRFETEGEAASVGGAASVLKKASGKIPDLLVAIATSRAFLYRTPVAGEGN